MALTGSHPDWLPDLLAIREANPAPEGHPHTWANALMTKLGITTNGGTVKALLKQHDALVEVAK